ncbi:hypothetical protein [Streptomyces sp. NPDC004579]|uniref:hypothetical protein n=1 Tax=Streptomyces sp. NPDC004579 TaxID=3154667 RepID=UPI0033BB5BA0
MIGNNRRLGRKMSLSTRMRALDTATQDHFERESFSIEKELHAIELRAEEIHAIELRAKEIHTVPAGAQVSSRRTSLKLLRMPRVRTALLLSFQFSAVAAVLVGIGAGVAWMFNHANGLTITWITVIASQVVVQYVIHALLGAIQGISKAVEALTRLRDATRRDKHIY